MGEIKSSIAFHALDIFFALCFTLNSLATVYVAAFSAINWSDLNGTQRSVVIAAMLSNWTGVLMAYFKQTRKRLQSGDPEPWISDTSITQKKQVAQADIKD